MIKKTTVLILVLVLVLSLSITCFAVGDEPTGDDEPSGGSSVDTSSLQDMFDDIGDKIDNLNLNIVNLIGDDNYTLLNIYYCHPFCSCERGTNENINKMIRRFFPKGMSLSKINNNDCLRVQEYINNYPRKILGNMTAKQVFDCELRQIS